ncbi:MAG: TA system VapC family ribonuclease toxin [Verrucomicrobiota bacterium]
MIHLLDINVLLALCDPAHPHAAAARDFFSGGFSRNGWATCPLVENGFLRILGSRKYPGGPGSPQGARPILSGLLATPGHQFWEDDLTLTAANVCLTLPASEAITDIYLLALAVKHKGRFATFDQSIDASLVPGGPAALLKL